MITNEFESDPATALAIIPGADLHVPVRSNIMPSRRPTRQLAQLFEHSRLPIYVLDETRELIYCNAALTDWLAVKAGDLIGRTCNYQSGETGDRIAEALAALCPPPVAFEGQQISTNLFWNDARGSTEQRSATFVPLDVEGSDGNSVLVVLAQSKPVQSNAALGDTADAQALHERIQLLTRQMRARYRLDRLVGDSPAIRQVRNQVRAAIASHSRVLITGPTGSGREHIARTIHYGDATDAAGPLCPLACPTLDGEILQSSILSLLRRTHDPSSKTPATVLLLEVDQLTATAQSELLAFLRIPTFSARTISTSRQILTQLAADGSFLMELARELSTVVIELPPLAERRQDIPIMAQRIVEEFNVAGGKQLAGFSPAALDRLSALPWKGDVDELTTVVQDACRNVTSVWIGEADLPELVRIVESAGSRPRRTSETLKLDEFLVEVERELIERAMKRVRGNKAKAAQLLGISRQRLLRRLTQLGLARPVETQIDFKLVDDSPEASEA